MPGYGERLRKAEAVARAGGIDALAVFDSPNLRYLCGFTGSSGALLIGRGEAAFFTDSRYTAQAGSEVSGAEVSTVQDLEKAVSKFAVERGYASLGLCAGAVSHKRWLKLAEGMDGVALSCVGDSLSALRAVKDGDEIHRMREAARLAEEAFRAVVGRFRPGVTEVEAALAFHLEALKRGARGLAFETIVASGPRGALPHGAPSDRPFAAGELVVFDFGVVLDGYCSDQTVTLPIGSVGGEEAEVYGVVLAAQRAALAAVTPGAPLKEVDGAARSVIADAGHGGHFGHGTGHGLGIEVHEPPTVGPNSAATAEVGMVFTVEPGIYLPERFGIRLEDAVLVTEGGHTLLTSLSKELGALN